MANIKYTVNQENPTNIPGVESISQTDTQLVSQFEINTLFNSNKNYVELHILNLVNELLQSDYNYINYFQLGNSQSAGKQGASVLTIDPIEDIKRYGYETGGVKLLYHFLNDLFSNNKTSINFFIDEISPDRTEVKLKTFELQDEDIVSRVSEIRNNLTTQSYFKEFRLNFKNNDLLIGTNIDSLQELIGTSVVVKLYEPLPVNYVKGNILTIVELVSNSISYEIDSVIEDTPPIQQYLRPANFNLETEDNTVIPTQYLNYSELFSYPVDNTNSQLYSLVNERGVELSVDYTDFSNFIHFSSAYERLANFKYKLQLLENYSASLEELQNATLQSIGTTGSVSYYESLTQGILNNFDSYERYLYYESSSFAWPKSNTTKPYINKLTTDIDAASWYVSTLTTANTYDASNQNALINGIPSFLRDDSNNENYLTFIHMIGQHFDNLWIYTKGVSDKYNADNRLDFGISKDLVAEVLKNFGVKLYTSNKSIEDLFSSFVGQSYQSGSEVINNYITGSVTGSNDSIQPSSLDNYQREVYKRIYHNLPLLLKSKGTERGLKALINCFGIPSDILDIKLYGGRDINERPFYGDFRYYTSSLDKIRLDNTGSIVSGSTLSQYTSILKREYKYTDDLHPIEIGFSPTDNVDNYIISKSLSTGSLQSFNIDDYLGDPRNLYLDGYYALSSTGDIQSSLTELTNTIMSGSDAYNVKDFVRLIKFFDNTIFKMVKDFIPARSTADTGIIIKPHLLQRNKIKSVEVSFTQPEYSGSIDTAFITGSSGGSLFSATKGIFNGELDTRYVRRVQTPLGVGVDIAHNRQQATLDGQFANSEIRVTNGELNQGNIFKAPEYIANLFNMYRWVNAEGICILNPILSYDDTQGDIYYYPNNNTFYLNSGSWAASDLLSGISSNMVYEITSSQVPTSSFQFPFSTGNYANYTTHSLTASNESVQEGECTSSFNMIVAVCDVEPTLEFRGNIKTTEGYNISSWFTTGSQNNSGNMLLTVVNNTAAQSVWEDLLENTTNLTFGGSTGDEYTLTLQDTAIPLTCTFNYNIAATNCSVIPRRVRAKDLIWKLDTHIGTAVIPGTLNEFSFGLARYFLGINPETLTYRIRIEDLSNITNPEVADFNVIPGGNGTGDFGPVIYDPNSELGKMFTYEWTYVEGTASGYPLIFGKIALLKIRYSDLFQIVQPEASQYPGIEASYIRVEVTALESPPECAPTVYISGPEPYDPGNTGGGLFTCCFTGETLITLPDYSQVRIDSLKVGDEVLSYNEETGEYLTSTISAITAPIKNDIAKYTLSDNTVVEATTEHPFWTVEKGWSSLSPSLTEKDHNIQVNLIQEGDTLITHENTQVQVLDITLPEDREYEKVYNFKLEGHYTYFANKILVHNKDEIGAAGGCIYDLGDEFTQLP